MLADLVRACRSIRRFRQDAAISRQTLLDLIDVGRLSASGSNLQPLKYWISVDPATNAKIFPHLSWAGYLTDWPGPEEGERPAAYIVVLGDKKIREDFGIDPGIAAQTIMLAACEKGIGGCMLTSVQRAPLRRALAIPEQYDILLVLALGLPVEKVVLEDVGPDGSIKYWRDADRVHHVPKRSLREIVIN